MDATPVHTPRVTKRSAITSLRWGTVAYTAGSGLHVGCGDQRVYANAVGIDTMRSAACDMVMSMERGLPFTDRLYDFVVVGDAMRRVTEPRALLAEAWRVLVEGGFLILVQPTSVAVGWLTDAAEDHALVDQLQLGVLRVDVICKLPAGSGREDARLPVAEKTVAVWRPGGYGDALWAASLLPALKREGYQITVYTDPMGEEVLRYDPHIDCTIVMGHGTVQIDQLGQFFAHEQERYDRVINLIESVEKNLLASSNDMRFFWPAAERRRIFNRSYIEAVHDLAGLPHDFQQRFYPTEDEIRAAGRRRGGSRKHCVIAASGSTLPKWWPYLNDLADALIVRGFQVWLLGDLRDLQLKARPGLHVVGTTWSIREAMTFALQSELVIGQETAITNAVALEPMLKVVLLSHSTAENLTKHWINTVALHGTPACYPCHQIHLLQNGWHHCNLDEQAGAARCQSTISLEQILAPVDVAFTVRAVA